jgi:hypothetical protein
MRPAGDIERLIRDVPINTSAARDEEVLDDVLSALDKSRNVQSVAAQPSMWRIVMKSKASRLAAAITVFGVVLSLFVFEKLDSIAWAIEQTLEALKGFRAVHVVGAFPGGTAEIWMRANKAGTQSTDVVVKRSHGTLTWTREGSTYHYEPSQNTVYFENAITIGTAQWLGPELLKMLSQAENAEIVHGRDAATGQDRVMLSCSMIDVHGPQSWIIEFDVASKLPVAFKQWQNLGRSGPPSFNAFKLTYYEDLPDSMFEVHIPGSPAYSEKPMTIPDENIGVLSNPRHGISAEGLTQQTAAGKAIRTMCQAVIDMDLEQLKGICPLCQNWGDEFLRTLILKPGKDDRMEEVLEIGAICGTGRSKLGPIVAIPVVYRLHNGTKIEQKMIVQFREIGGKSSCVVHGPYGLPREME